MLCIVPLAGPDFVHPTKGIKPLMPLDGEALLRRVITSRPWWRSGDLQSSGLIFVLRDLPETPQVLDCINEWFPGANHVLLNSLTSGALMSTLAGISLVKDFHAPLCVDLVDILYDTQELMFDYFQKDETVGGIVPYFTSQEPCYSYFEINQERLVTRAVEKKVISSNASAGTYFFRNAATYLRAVAYSLNNRKELSFKDILFVCPAMNYMINTGETVIPIQVNSVQSISKIFH